MVFASQCREFEKDGFKMFLYGPGHTVSNLSQYNTVKYGAKPVEVAVLPVIEMLNGKRDKDMKKYIEYGVGVFPW